jgi:hypothetical protein
VKSNKPTTQKNQSNKRALKKAPKRARLFELLERRELMAGDFSPSVESLLSRMYFRNEDAYTRAGTVMSGGGTGSTGGTGGIGSGETNNPLAISEVEPNNFVARAQLLPLSASQPVNVSGTFATLIDEDYFALDLNKGDILDTRLVGFAGTRPSLVLLDANTQELLFAQGRFLNGTAYPPSSPLYKDGLTTLPYVIATSGRYYMRVADGVGSYVLNLRVHRSTFEAEPIGTQQTLYIDFDGAFTRSETLNLTALGVPAGTLRIPPLSRYMPQLGLTTADAPSVARNTMARLEQKMRTSLAARSNNGFYGATGNPGEFDVRLVSSYDSPDLWGQPNVSRVLVGGTQTEIGLDPNATRSFGVHRGLLLSICAQQFSRRVWPPKSHRASPPQLIGMPSGSASIAPLWSARCIPGRSLHTSGNARCGTTVGMSSKKDSSRSTTLTLRK